MDCRRRSEQVLQDTSPLLLFRFSRCIQRLAQISRMFPSRDQIGIYRVIWVAGQHLLELCCHGKLSPSFAERVDRRQVRGSLREYPT